MPSTQSALSTHEYKMLDLLTCTSDGSMDCAHCANEQLHAHIEPAMKSGTRE